MSFRDYHGNDKYHFRVYKKAKNHPCIIVLVDREENDNGVIYLSGFIVTHSIQDVLNKPEKYLRLSQNPNPNDDAECFVNTTRITNKASGFSKPYNNWHLSEDDEKLIDSIA